MAVAAEHINWFNAEYRKLLIEKNEITRQAIVQTLVLKVNGLFQEGATDALVRLLGEVVRKAGMAMSMAAEAERLAALDVIEGIVVLAPTIDEIALKIPELVQLVHAEIERKETALVAERGAKVMGSLLANAGLEAERLIAVELSSAASTLKDGRNEVQVNNGLLVCHCILSRCREQSVPFVAKLASLLWPYVVYSKQTIRELSVRLFGIALEIALATDTDLYLSLSQRGLQEVMVGMKASGTSTLHGSLLLLKSLVKRRDPGRWGPLMEPLAYMGIMDILMARLIGHKDQLVRGTSIDLVPVLAGMEDAVFREKYMARWIAFLMDSIKKDRDRLTSLQALDRTLNVCESDALAGQLESIVRMMRMMLQLKGRHRDMPEINAAFRLISSLTRIFGSKIRPSLHQMLPQMTSFGIWEEQLRTLSTICTVWPEATFFFEGPLMLSVKQSLASEDPSILAVGLMALALFDFTEPILTGSTGRALIDRFIVHDAVQVRCATATAVLSLCRRSLQTRLCPDWVVVGYLSAALTRMVADAEPSVPSVILGFFLENGTLFRDVLGHVECLRPLFIFLGSNNVSVEQRCQAATILGSLTEKNIATLLPHYRKLLLQYLSEIECINAHTLLKREDSARLLYQLLQWPGTLAHPYVQPLLKSILPRLGDGQVDFAVNMIGCMGRLVEISVEDCEPMLSECISRLQTLMSDQSSTARRKASLAVMCTLLRRVDRRLVSREVFCALLGETVDILKVDLDQGVRMEALRLAGIIGAVDPFLMKAKELTAWNGADGALEDVSGGGNAAAASLSSNPEEFFAITAVSSLVRIMRDGSLASHHIAAVQALVQLFRGFGQRSHQFLNTVVPVLIGLVKTCAPSSAEFYVQQLASVASAVGIHIRGHVGDLLQLISTVWTTHTATYPAVFHFIDTLVGCLKGEFRHYIPQVLSLVLEVLEVDTGSIAVRPFVICRALGTLSILGPQLTDYAGIVGDTLVLLLRQSQFFRDVRVAALRATAGVCKDLPAVADNPAVFQSLISILETAEDQQVLEHGMDAIVMVAMAQGKDFFRFLPQLAKTVASRHIRHNTFERLLAANLNSPAKLADIASESLRALETKMTTLSIAGSSGPASPYAGAEPADFSETQLRRTWAIGGCLERGEWMEWLRRLSHELMRESPSPALRSCATLASIYHPLSKELFNVACASCLEVLGAEAQDDFIETVEGVLGSANVPPEVIQMLLNLAEFMERQEKPLPIDVRTLGAYAARCHAYAKALYYKELEFNSHEWRESPDASVVESLISINSQIQQPDAALGVLVHAHRQFGVGLKESWYERLQRWHDAMRAYEGKWRADPASFEAAFGIARCRHALGEWEGLEGLARDLWPRATASVRSAMAPLAAASAWGLQDWPRLAEYVEALPSGSIDAPFFRGLLAVNAKDWPEALSCINATRRLVDTELAALLSESYGRAYNVVVRMEVLSELEEIVGAAGLDPTMRRRQVDSWTQRLELVQSNVDVWSRILKVRSLQLSPTAEPELWIRHVDLCRKSGRPNLAWRVLKQLMGLSQNDAAVHAASLDVFPAQLVRADPRVVYAYLKFRWDYPDSGSDCIEDGQDTKNSSSSSSSHALRLMKNYSRFLSHEIEASQEMDGGEKDRLVGLLARCYYKSSKWERQLLSEQSHQPLQLEEGFKGVLDGYLAATAYDKTWYKAWHGWALANFEMAAVWERNQQLLLLQHQEKLQTDASSHPSPPHSHIHLQSQSQLHLTKGRLNPYLVPAIQGFFKSIALSSRRSLQDSLRVLTLWFRYGSSAEVNAAVGDGFYSVPVENWLQVIPQLIARIHVTTPQVRRLVHQVLADIGRYHPQALVYSMMVASKSPNLARRTAATAVLDKMRAHSASLVDQVLLVGQELIRVAILWEEMWHEGLEEASKLYFGEHNIPAMFAVLEPLHQMLEKGSPKTAAASTNGSVNVNASAFINAPIATVAASTPLAATASEQHFIQQYGNELGDARELCLRYKRTGVAEDLNAAWDVYYQVFRRINKSLPQLTQLSLASVSPRLMCCRDLELAIPGTYNAGVPVVRIAAIGGRIDVIASKQRPRKLTMLGSDGRQHVFLLKGHEDLRQDERVMQLFGLVNTLLAADSETHKRHLGIERFAVVPLSQNSGLIGWLQHCDTMHTLVRDYRETRGVPLSLEHRTMLQRAPDYDHLTRQQKVEVFAAALAGCAGDDLARVFWLRARNAESWLERRTGYCRSLAVMSMVGYVLGLGDRHPSNLMVDQTAGRVVHIDFGDCFEVAMHRERFPERVPFRLTRMLVRAMEAGGYEGTFRLTCEATMRVLRTNKDSLMAVLEAFVYDPLINWRLLPTRLPVGDARPIEASASTLVSASAAPGLRSFTDYTTAGSWARFPDRFSSAHKLRRDAEISKLEEESLARPEALNAGAISVVNRVSSKLTGRDFRPPMARRPDGDEFIDFTPKGRDAPEPESESGPASTSPLPSLLSCSTAAQASTEWPLPVRSQVDRLIHEATRPENLCQAYIGWCPFW